MYKLIGIKSNPGEVKHQINLGSNSLIDYLEMIRKLSEAAD